jgi:hypothetical protein
LSGFKRMSSAETRSNRRMHNRFCEESKGSLDSPDDA